MTPILFYEIHLFCLITVRRRKDDVLHEENEIGSLLGDTNHSNNGTDCIHELDKCIPSSGIDKGKTFLTKLWKQNTTQIFFFFFYNKLE